jgi:Uma2 family endonuclease
MIELLTEPGSQVTYQPAETADRDEEFERVCRLYPEMRIEMDESGNIIFMPPGSLDSGFHSNEATVQLALWSRKDGTGRAFDGTTIWTLPSGAKRSPDASWAPKTMLRQLTREELQSVSKGRLCPPFIIEVRSPSDRLKAQQDKCREWIKNGTQEALLVDPQKRTVYRFLPSADMETIINPERVESSYLKQFTLECAPFWEELLDE